MRYPKHLGVVGEREHLASWFERLRTGKLAVDTEHTGFNWLVDRVGGLCLAAGESALYCYGDALGPAARWLGDQVRGKRPLTFHSAKGDLHQLRETFGIHVDYPVDDVHLQSFLLDNRGAFASERAGHGSHALKELAAAYVDPDAREAETELTAAWKKAGGRTKGDLLMAPPRIAGRYGALDAWYTLALDRQFVPAIRSWVNPAGDYPSLRKLYETERWVILAFRDMEEVGVPLDVDYIERWGRKLKRKIARLERDLEAMAGKRIEWASTPQLRTLLFETLRLDVTKRTEKTQAASTDEGTLLKLKHPIGALLLQWREATKQHSAYAVGLLKHVWRDGRIHAHFKPTGADTGRGSCEDPNLQQQTRESGVRDGFPIDKGRVYRFADYSQIEMRFAADASGDPTLVEGFRHDPDFDTHAATAREMFGVRAPTPRQRKYAKIMNFTMLFGGGEDKVTEQLVLLVEVPEAIAGCRELGHKVRSGEAPHRSLAQLLRTRYFQKFAAVKGALHDASELAELRGLVMNDFGRHRFLDDKLYRAFNTRVQGNAGDKAKEGFVALYRELQVRDRTIQLVLQIHDEAVYFSDGDPTTDRRALDLLKDTQRFQVPILADMSGSSTTWQRKEKVKL